jgi:hypothetical protein
MTRHTKPAYNMQRVICARQRPSLLAASARALRTSGISAASADGPPCRAHARCLICAKGSTYLLLWLPSHRGWLVVALQPQKNTLASSVAS